MAKLLSLAWLVIAWAFLAGGTAFAADAPRGPVVWWPLDGAADPAASDVSDAKMPGKKEPMKKSSLTRDAASGRNDPVQGDFEYIPGVRGRCLKLSEANTALVRPAGGSPKFPTGAFTIEAWVALQTYPWNWCPIVCQQQNGKGYFFGLDSDGRFGLRVSVDGQWRHCYSRSAFPGLDVNAVRGISGWMTARGVKPTAQDRPNPAVPLLVWSHLVGTFDPSVGLTIYRNGREEGRVPIEGDFTPAPTADLIVGQTPEKIPVAHAERLPHGSLPTTFSLDGLLDEVKIYDRALTAGEIQSRYEASAPAVVQPLQFRKLPTGPLEPGRFGAYYVKLRYDETFDKQFRMGDAPDVVVRFDEMPVTVVCWRGINYYPIWYTENGIGTMHEAYETWGPHGCYEAMSDKQCRYSRVRILESNDARVVLHWRHALAGVDYSQIHEDPKTGWGDWCDDYYTIYPDGIAARKSILWSTDAPRGNHSLGGDNFVLPIGRAVWDCFEKNPLTFVDLEGRETPVQPQIDYPQYGAEAKDKVIQFYNLNAKYKTFEMYLPGSVRIGTFAAHLPWPWSFPWWNHWPLAQVPSDGRAVWVIDGRPSSTAMTQPEFYKKDPRFPKTDHSLTLFTMQGITGDKRPGQLAPIVRAWAQAPPLTIAGDDYAGGNYDLGGRCYVVTRRNRAASSPLECTLQASRASPLANLAMVVEGWGEDGAELTLDAPNGKNFHVAAGKGFRVGHRRTLEGADLILWLKIESESPVTLRLTPKP